MSDIQTRFPQLDAFLNNPLAATAAYYATCLQSNVKAMKFVARTLELSLDLDNLGIGFCDRTLGKQFPSNQIKAGKEIRTQLTALGLYKDSGHETLRGCVTIPLVDGQGNVTGLEAYRIDASNPIANRIMIGSGVRKPTTADLANRLNATVAAAQPIIEEHTPAPKTSPSSKASETVNVVDPSCITFARDDRNYRIAGLEKNTTLYQLKVQIMAVRDELVHLDSLDLGKARSRQAFIRATATELLVDEDIIKKDVGRLLLALETLRHEQIAQAKSPTRQTVVLSDSERNEALALLRDPKLLQRIVSDLDACGIVGERTNKLAGYLAATSRKLSDPLAVVIQSSSSAGKTSLMDAILSMLPQEEQLRFSELSGQSLYYLERDQLKHKTLAISEEIGIADASYALKLLQSEKELRHATVSRDSSGRMVTQEYHVEGPVQLMFTTTASEIEEELLNRCMVLTVDESRLQTDAIQSKQRDARTLNGLNVSISASRIQRIHQNAQRLLQPIRIVNPYAPQLTFTSDKTRLRRDHAKYLTLIDTIALLHQHQRPLRHTQIAGATIDYISVEPSDIAIANGIAGEVLGRSLDELSPQTRTCLLLTHQFVQERSNESGVPRIAFRFTRRDLREAIQWSDFQLRTHLKRLVELEYFVVHRGKQGRRFVYEMVYQGEGREGQPFLLGLLDPSKLQPPPTSSTQRFDSNFEHSQPTSSPV